jgi:hypothetical protein
MKTLLLVVIGFGILTEGVATANVPPPWTARRASTVPDSLNNWFTAASAAMASKDMKAAKGLCDPRFYASRRATDKSPTLEELFAEGVEKGLSLRADFTEVWATQFRDTYIVRTTVHGVHGRVVPEIYIYIDGERGLDGKFQWVALGVAPTRFDAVGLVRRTYERNLPLDRLD